MRYLWTAVVVLVAGLAICGCQSTGERFSQSSQIPPGKGLIYVYRMANFAGAVRRPDIFINKNNIGPLPMDGYFVMAANPGPMRIEAHLEMVRPDIQVNIEQGKATYVRAQVGMGGFVLRNVGEQEALAELAKCRLQEMKPEK